ncbi:MAG: DUF4145 domain-containing protein, partial [Phycisphaerales bacterium]|nr:DUF4145 domain-containing protein [Phycisphaerales bacterium]
MPTELAKDYTEACRVLGDSPRAAAALARMCLQRLLREYGGVKKAALCDEIEEYAQQDKLPSMLADDLHAIRKVGNTAVHPIKNKCTGEIVSVDSGDAEYLLRTL